MINENDKQRYNVKINDPKMTSALICGQCYSTYTYDSFLYQKEEQKQLHGIDVGFACPLCHQKFHDKNFKDFHELLSIYIFYYKILIDKYRPIDLKKRGNPFV